MFFTDYYNGFIIKVHLKDKKVIIIMGVLEHFWEAYKT